MCLALRWSRGPGTDQRVLPSGKPPRSVAAYQHVERHLRQRACDIRGWFERAADGGRGRLAGPVRRRRPGPGQVPGRSRSTTNAAPRLLFQADTDGVELLVALQGGTNRAAHAMSLAKCRLVMSAPCRSQPACNSSTKSATTWFAPVQRHHRCRRRDGSARVRRDRRQHRASAGPGGPDRHSS